MKEIVNPIIPQVPVYLGETGELDYKAISIFCALGFFLGEDTYFKTLKCLSPATRAIISDRGVEKQDPYFKWEYAPRDITFEQATDEFAHLFEKITRQLVGDKKVILPLSGGLDSRSQAACLKGRRNVFAYSYEFQGSFEETKYGRDISCRLGWDFQKYTIPKSYLWDCIDKLARLNGCYSEFTHPRQMAIFDEYPAMGDIFYLGHWGDVLYDDMGIADNASFEEQMKVLRKKVVKKGGLELGRLLWDGWGLSGDFNQELDSVLAGLLSGIKIDNANARIRAFKSMYWAPRWTSVNLAVFQALHPVALPYYHDEMCRFVCTVPEAYLAGRQMQIEYIKRKAPELAAIPWQTYDPFNLYSYRKFFGWQGLAVRGMRKAKRTIDHRVLGKPSLRQRNWENQFIGTSNEARLRDFLFSNPSFNQFVPKEVVEAIYKKFKEEDTVYYSHPVSMLLTLSLFAKQNL